ncbi:unnamed protein product [Amoebophrya sp. A25]|nr:unnamed protein product [Amoebophrya sp. A25]|eukprot:GSA25T00011079001.1
MGAADGEFGTSPSRGGEQEGGFDEEAKPSRGLCGMCGITLCASGPPSKQGAQMWRDSTILAMQDECLREFVAMDDMFYYEKDDIIMAQEAQMKEGDESPLPKTKSRRPSRWIGKEGTAMSNSLDTPGMRQWQKVAETVHATMCADIPRAHKGDRVLKVIEKVERIREEKRQNLIANDLSSESSGTSGGNKMANGKATRSTTESSCTAKEEEAPAKEEGAPAAKEEPAKTASPKQGGKKKGKK